VCSLQRTGGWGAGATPWQAGKLGQHQLKRTRDAEGHGGEGKAACDRAPRPQPWTWAPGRSGARVKGSCCFKAYLCRQSSELYHLSLSVSPFLF
jgi:hypothetical protein